MLGKLIRLLFIRMKEQQRISPFSHRKLSTYTICRDPMLDSMCLLSICKQLFAAKIPLRKEAMKAVLEWNIEGSDRSRAQVIFVFLRSNE